MNVHPKTGFRYVHVVPDEWGPFFDTRATCLALSRRFGWMTAVSPAELDGMMKEDSYRMDGRLFFICWGNDNPIVPPRDDRKAIISVVYLESAGDPKRMLPRHIGHWEQFVSRCESYDAIFTHTPWMVKKIGNCGRPTYLYPLGWEPESSGRPRFNACKDKSYVFYGSIAGKRQMIIPFVKEQLGPQLRIVSGTYGRSLQGLLDESRASLHIAHSNVTSFPQWRIWQTVSSSAALVTEPANFWPLEKDAHCVVIDTVTAENGEHTVRSLRRILKDVDLLKIARQAYHKAQDFTSEKCVEQYLLPASEQIRSTRLD